MLNEGLSLVDQIKIYSSRANDAYNRAMSAKLCGDFKTAEFHMNRHMLHSNYVAFLTAILAEEEGHG